MTDQTKPSFNEWMLDLKKKLDAAQPYSEFERILKEAEEEKSRLFGDGI